jgi:ABC-type glutathione transport system ATPase component
MYQGKLVEQGPVEKVLSNPQHEYTKRLMADVPLLHGRNSILEEDDSESVESWTPQQPAEEPNFRVMVHDTEQR